MTPLSVVIDIETAGVGHSWGGRNGALNPDQPHSWGWFFKLRWWSGEGCSYPLFRQSGRRCSYPILMVPKLIVVCNGVWCHDDAGHPVETAQYRGTTANWRGAPEGAPPWFLGAKDGLGHRAPGRPMRYRKGAAFYLGALHFALVSPRFNYLSRIHRGYKEGRYRGMQGETARNKKARTRRAS
jgi:hypothetical protein